MNEEKSKKPESGAKKPEKGNAEKHFPADSHAPQSVNSQSQPQNIKDKPQTEEMEVHKHPHHLTHSKKWTEYLLEFFMLFLAVFLGFVAENVRENIVEKHREKEYVISELNDLQIDTMRFNRIILRTETSVKQLDTLIEYLHSPQPKYLNDIYYLGRVSSLNPRFNYSDRTIQQLKNAGGLRLIKNKTVSDSIIVYDSRISIIKSQDELISQAAIDYRNEAAAIFDPYIFYEIMKGTLVTAQRPVNFPPLTTYDKKTINNVLSKLMYLRSIIVVTKELYKSTRDIAVRLIEIIKKEYHLKNE